MVFVYSFLSSGSSSHSPVQIESMCFRGDGTYLSETYKRRRIALEKIKTSSVLYLSTCISNGFQEGSLIPHSRASCGSWYVSFPNARRPCTQHHQGLVVSPRATCSDGVNSAKNAQCCSLFQVREDLLNNLFENECGDAVCLLLSTWECVFNDGY